MSKIQLHNHTKNLLESLNNQRLNGGHYCDVNITSIDGSSFKAHSSVLAACTPKLINKLQLQLDVGNQLLELPLLADCDCVTSLMDAVYSGQVTVKQSSDVSNLLQLAIQTGFSELFHALSIYSKASSNCIVGEKTQENVADSIALNETYVKEELERDEYEALVPATEQIFMEDTKTQQQLAGNINLESTNSKLDKYECTLCSKIFSTKASLKYHNVRVHKMIEDVPTWMCPSSDCGQILIRKSSYDDHLIRHGLKEKLKCTVCKSEFIASKAYKKHVLVCQHAGQLTKKKETLSWKASVSGANTAKKRKQCSLESEKEEDGQNIETTESNVAPLKTTKVRKPHEPKQKAEEGICDICGKTLINKKLLSRHYTNMHKITYTGNIEYGKRKSVCEVCGEFFSTKNQLINHQIRIHKFNHLATEGKNYYCKTCNTLCIYKSDYEDHQRRHGLLPKLMCHMCARPFAQRNNFLRHTKNKLCQPDATVAKRPNCDICSHTFASSASLKRHQIAMHGFSHLSKHYCDFCQSPCKDSSDFKNHMVKHGIAEKHSCDICNKKYADYRTMTKHRAKHPEWKGKNYKVSKTGPCNV